MVDISLGIFIKIDPNTGIYFLDLGYALAGYGLFLFN